MSEEGQGPREAGAEATTERVAAILAADAVGYTRLMADDEKATLAALDRAGGVPEASLIFLPAAPSMGSRIVKEKLGRAFRCRRALALMSLNPPTSPKS